MKLLFFKSSEFVRLHHSLNTLSSSGVSVGLTPSQSLGIFKSWCQSRNSDIFKPWRQSRSPTKYEDSASRHSEV